MNMTICLSHKLYSMTTMAIFKYCVGCLYSVVSALELKDHLYKQAKNLSAGLKRKVSQKYNSVQKIENHTLSCTLGLFFVFFMLVVLCTKHAGKSSDSSVGRTIYRHGSQIKTAHVVIYYTKFLSLVLVFVLCIL